MLGRRFQAAGKSSLLSRYSETLGELTMRRQTELALLVAKTEAELASRAKSAFLGTMSHELRTPLNAIIGFSDLIQNMKADDKAVETSIDYASHIAKAGRHLLDVVSDILDISKIESGTFQLNLDTFPIAEIVADCVPLIEERVAAKNQILEVRLDSGLPHIPVDARRIKQIVINLLSNANKFTPDRGRILLIARRNEDGGVTIAVVDTGIGMTPDQIAIALKPFGQVQSSRSRSYEGTGLGLSIARGLAKQHGGDLYIESELGAGTSAVLTLRAAPPDPKAQPPSIIASGGGERRVPRRPTFTPKDEIS
jgi:two-component system cell cycle sensor histidine kinase PleC